MIPVLSDDQEFFRATTARFLDEFAPPATVRELRDDPDGFGRDYWRRGAELGWTSLLVSEANGGGSISGRGLVDLTIVAYEFGVHAAPGPLLSCNLVASALSRANSHADVLCGVIAGTTLVSWCDGSGTFKGPGRLNVTIDGNDLVLNGVARPVESAAISQYLLVSAQGDSGLSQLLVPTAHDGISITPMVSVDLTRRFSLVRFDAVRVPLAQVLVGEAGGAADAYAQQALEALVIACAESVGAMQRAFDMTVEWSFDRYSFGRPLASYQALKHRFADMKAWLEGSHAIADRAAIAVADGAAIGPELASAAKSFIGEYGSELMHDCVQLHGGLGVTYEHDVHLFLRRHTLNRSMFGTPAEHRQIIANIVETNEDNVA